MAIADFGCTFHHDGKISPGCVKVRVARPPPCTLVTITYKVAVYAPAERADALTLLISILLCTPWRILEQYIRNMFHVGT